MEFTLITLCWVKKLLLTAIKGIGHVEKKSMCSFNKCFGPEVVILPFSEMKAGQKPGVSYERYAKQSVVCQDTLRVPGHWLCPRVIYHPSQWAHSCLA